MMKLRTRSFGLAAVLALIAFSAPALSQDTGWHAGFNFGQAKADVDCTGTTECDGKDTAWSVFAGYRLNRDFAVELGHANLGKVSASGIDPILGTFSTAIEVTGFELSGVGVLPINQEFYGYGKLGLFIWDLDATVTSSTFGSGALSEDGADLTFGIGARYLLTRTLALQLQWQRYSDIGDDATTGKSDIDVIGAGIVFGF